VAVFGFFFVSFFFPFFFAGFFPFLFLYVFGESIQPVIMNTELETNPKQTFPTYRVHTCGMPTYIYDLGPKGYDKESKFRSTLEFQVWGNQPTCKPRSYIKNVSQYESNGDDGVIGGP
jgi:hypothetical protein